MVLFSLLSFVFCVIYLVFFMVLCLIVVGDGCCVVYVILRVLWEGYMFVIMGIVYFWLFVIM